MDIMTQSTYLALLLLLGPTATKDIQRKIMTEGEREGQEERDGVKHEMTDSTSAVSENHHHNQQHVLDWWSY